MEGGQVTAGARHCVSCGRSIAWDANVCPYCGHDYRFQAYAGSEYPQAEPINGGLKAVFYILSLLIWIAGLVIGLIYITKPDPESKHVGKMCLILMAVSLVLTYGLTLVLYVLILWV